MSKNTILTGGICFLLVFLLLHPAESLSCARAGMTLWLNTLIPTLLPFIILTGMLTHTGHIRKLLLPFESFFHIFPGVSIWGGYVFVLGMLCGYPLGAKLASDLYGLHKISKKEALYLTTFCNNPSPAFIITYLCKSCLKDTVPAGMVFASIFSANLICMLFFRFFVYQNATISDSPEFSPEISSRKNILDFSNHYTSRRIYSIVLHSGRMYQILCAFSTSLSIPAARIYRDYFRTFSYFSFRTAIHDSYTFVRCSHRIRRSVHPCSDKRCSPP